MKTIATIIRTLIRELTKNRLPIKSIQDETETIYDDHASGILGQLRNIKQVNRPMLPEKMGGSERTSQVAAK